MTKTPCWDVAIVDFGVGNLFSVQRACERAGLVAGITSRIEEIEAARAVVLPGVGAFGDAMRNLTDLGLVDTLRRVAASGAPLIGICLGLQLLMTESEEFGVHAGLDIIPGRVRHLGRPCQGARRLKVPHVGWTRIRRPESAGDAWTDTPLEGIADGAYQYFVHSYYVAPDDPGVALALTCYGDVEFVSAVRKDNVFAFQFHPERSGVEGIAVYRNIARLIRSRSQERKRLHAA